MNDASPMTPTHSAKPRVLFFSTIFPPFIADDERLLQHHYELSTIISSGISALARVVLELPRHDIAFVWFGSVYSGIIVWLARVFHKPSIIVVAGVDASKDREINYGIWLSPWKSRFVRYAFRNASCLLVVDPFLGREAIRLAEYDGKNITYLPFGFDPLVWTGTTAAREKIVLTVASCENEWRAKKKGVDKLIDAARALPEISFRLIGIHQQLLNRIKADIPRNMEVIPYVPRHELAAEYARAKVYCQPSFTEGLPNTLCEAMLSGCIPVGTIAGGIPTAIGTTGYLVEYRDQQGLVDALKRAIEAPESDGARARERIKSTFTVERREEGLRSAIDALLHRPESQR
jgi:glycosyltransferase involved in cell wall biosynthesis